MPELSFMLAGDDAGDAATALIAALDGGDGIEARTSRPLRRPRTSTRSSIRSRSPH